MTHDIDELHEDPKSCRRGRSCALSIVYPRCTDYNAWLLLSLKVTSAHIYGRNHKTVITVCLFPEGGYSL